MATPQAGWRLSARQLLAVVGLALMIGGAAELRAAPARQSASAVDIADFAFTPATLEVPVGTTVTWTNADSAPHTATARDGSFNTGRIADGESRSVTLNTAGTFEYYCAVHPRMVATLVVRAASAAPATMPNTGLSDTPSALLAGLGLLALLAGLGLTQRLRHGRPAR